MNRVLSTLAIAAVVPMTALSGYAKTVQVPGDAATIQGGVDLADDYDTVLVLPGAYSENIYILDKVLSVMSTAGPLVTHLQPLDPGAPLLSVLVWTPLTGSGSRNAPPEFSGFTVTGGGNSHTVYIDGLSTIVVRDNIFHDNIPPSIIDKSVIVCRGQSAPVITGNIFYANFGNTCVIVMEGSAQIINNTFDGNKSAFLSSSDMVLALNNIVVNSTGVGINGSFLRLDYNDVWSNFSNYG